MRTLVAFAVVILVAGASAQPRELNNDERALVGTWKSAGGFSYIDTTFEFRADGTYLYDAGQVSAWRIRHEGTFVVRPSRLVATDRILVLTPTKIITEPPATGQIALEVNRRMDNSARQFKISDSRGRWPSPTKTLQDLERDPSGAMQWWISKAGEKP